MNRAQDNIFSEVKSQECHKQRKEKEADFGEDS